MNLKRPLRGSETGADVRMVQRALNAWATGVDIPVSSRFDQTTRDRLSAFQASVRVKPASGKLGQGTLDDLWPYFDAYGRMRYRTFKVPTKADLVFTRLFDAMEHMAAATPGYLLGGGHGIPLVELDLRRPSDCSSSVSWVLWKAGLLRSEQALLSWDFLDWGEPGRGRLFTVWTNGHAGDNSHVWLQLYRSRFWRFDTNPAGDRRSPKSGPHLRYLPRWTTGFQPRHARGM